MRIAFKGARKRTVTTTRFLKEREMRVFVNSSDELIQGFAFETANSNEFCICVSKDDDRIFELEGVLRMKTQRLDVLIVLFAAAMIPPVFINVSFSD